jgi:hypothetical protein
MQHQLIGVACRRLTEGNEERKRRINLTSISEAVYFNTVQISMR